MRYAPEPWTAKVVDGVIVIVDFSGGIVCQMSPSIESGVNAERIVDCVNALSGLDDYDVRCRDFNPPPEATCTTVPRPPTEDEIPF